MSHFVCPSCDDKHEVFGPSTPFEKACIDLKMAELGRLPLDPLTSKRSDAGVPVVLDTRDGNHMRDAIMKLAESVWQKLGGE